MQYVFGDCALDPNRRELTRNAEAIAIGPQVFDLLLFLVQNRERVISGLKRISKPGRRVYASKDRLPRVLGGLGCAIISTSTGVCTAADASKKGIGGEVLAFVW